MNLRSYAKGKPCMIRIAGVCNFNSETTVLAHIRMPGISGTGKKAPDLLGSWACSDCHAYVDSRRNDRDQLAFMHGVMRTQYQLLRDGVLKLP